LRRTGWNASLIIKVAEVRRDHQPKEPNRRSPAAGRRTT
jgi:hypothetical protein